MPKQMIKLRNFPFFTKKAMQNQAQLKQMLSACLSQNDYKLALLLISNGSVEDNRINIESFAHRIGKIIDIEFSEKNDE